MKIERRVFIEVISAGASLEETDKAIKNRFNGITMKISQELEGYRIINIIENGYYRNNPETFRGEYVLNVVVWCERNDFIDDFDETCK